MILLVEPISKKIDMYIPAYPLPILELASLVRSKVPQIDIQVISIPIDYGLPLNEAGKEMVYNELLRDIVTLRPKGVGISCTAISQAEEVIGLFERIKERDPSIFTFLGGYFPTIYYEEVFCRTDAVDLIVIGEGEIPLLELVRRMEKGVDPRRDDIPNLAWKKDGRIHLTKQGKRFDLRYKALLDLGLLKYPRAYDILPYAFSRGCPFHCNFCMEEYIRPVRKEVPASTVRKDLTNLTAQADVKSLAISDSLFRSFDLFPFLESLGLKINFETRSDVLDPSIIPRVAHNIGLIALGFESASYDTLKRMNKVKDVAHYEHYISNTVSIFREAVRSEIPIILFMIAGYPGDTERDLEKSFNFAKGLSEMSGVGGHVFKIGECHVYPKTKIHDLALSLPDVIFDNDGVFGENVVRKSSRDLDFDTIKGYSREIFRLSSFTDKLRVSMANIMPFFRIPVKAYEDTMVPHTCFRDNQRAVFDTRRDNLAVFKGILPDLIKKYRNSMADERSTRLLPI